MAILFDTGALELLRRKDRAAELLAIRFHPTLICTHIAGEYMYGVIWGGVTESAFTESRDFVKSFEMLLPSFLETLIYASLRTDLRRRGLRLPDPDIWIAACAIHHSLPIATTDGNHFGLFADKIHVHVL